MSTKKWLPGEDNLLIKMWQLKRFSAAALATRFGCSVEEVCERLAYLRTPPVNGAPDPNAKSLPSENDVEEAVKYLNNLQAAFTRAAVAFNVLGEQLRVCAEFMSATMTRPELIDAMTDVIEAPRLLEESTEEKLARLLTEQYIIIPKHVSVPPDTRQEQQTSGSPS